MIIHESIRLPSNETFHYDDEYEYDLFNDMLFDAHNMTPAEFLESWGLALEEGELIAQTVINRHLWGWTEKYAPLPLADTLPEGVMVRTVAHTYAPPLPPTKVIRGRTVVLRPVLFRRKRR